MAVQAETPDTQEYFRKLLDVYKRRGATSLTPEESYYLDSENALCRGRAPKGCFQFVFCHRLRFIRRGVRLTTSSTTADSSEACHVSPSFGDGSNLDHGTLGLADTASTHETLPQSAEPSSDPRAASLVTVDGRGLLAQEPPAAIAPSPASVVPALEEKEILEAIQPPEHDVVSALLPSQHPMHFPAPFLSPPSKQERNGEEISGVLSSTSTLVMNDPGFESKPPQTSSTSFLSQASLSPLAVPTDATPSPPSLFTASSSGCTHARDAVEYDPPDHGEAKRTKRK